MLSQKLTNLQLYILRKHENTVFTSKNLEKQKMRVHWCQYKN